MSKHGATAGVQTVGGAVPAGGTPFGLVPIVTVVANTTDVTSALLDLARRIQALSGEQHGPEVNGILLDLARTIRATIGEIPPPFAGRIIDVGELRIEVEAQRVTVGGEEVFLTALEFKLLVALADRRERVQSRSVLLSQVWSCSPETKTRTVDTHVKRLRDKLRTAGRFIRTVRGTGYLFSDRASEARPLLTRGDLASVP